MILNVIFLILLLHVAYSLRCGECKNSVLQLCPGDYPDNIRTFTKKNGWMGRSIRGLKGKKCKADFVRESCCDQRVKICLKQRFICNANAGWVNKPDYDQILAIYRNGGLQMNEWMTKCCRRTQLCSAAGVCPVQRPPKPNIYCRNIPCPNNNAGINYCCMPFCCGVPAGVDACCGGQSEAQALASLAQADFDNDYTISACCHQNPASDSRPHITVCVEGADCQQHHRCDDGRQLPKIAAGKACDSSSIVNPFTFSYDDATNVHNGGKGAAIAPGGGVVLPDGGGVAVVGSSLGQESVRPDPFLYDLVTLLVVGTLLTIALYILKSAQFHKTELEARLVEEET